MAFAVIEKRTDKRKERTFGPLLDGLNYLNSYGES
jgi:hypothetical protein